MPPARTIIVDTDRMLRTIAQQADQQRTAADNYHDATPLMDGDRLRREDLERARWVSRDLQLLAGKSLTASERIRHQQAIRRLADDGLVVLDTRHVKLTDAGREHVAKLQAEPATDG